MLFLEMLEVAIGLLMEADQDCHNLTQTQTPNTIAAFDAVAQPQSLPLRFKHLAEIIDFAEQSF
jgi:hypothetical protein